MLSFAFNQPNVEKKFVVFTGPNRDSKLTDLSKYFNVQVSKNFKDECQPSTDIIWYDGPTDDLSSLASYAKRYSGGDKIMYRDSPVATKNCPILIISTDRIPVFEDTDKPIMDRRMLVHYFSY